MNTHDPYQLRPEDIAEPPATIFSALRRIGPGMILAAAIVGSGELIATTTLGAQVGYTALWIVILSCLIKPVIQAEMGRFTIASGETALAAFNHVPGPRLRINWIVIAWALMVLMTLLQVGAMFGGVAQVMNLVLPAISVNVWVIMLLVLTLALLLGGGYDRIERLAVIQVGLFTLLTLMASLVLMRMPQYFSWQEVAEGFKFQLPGQGISTAIAAFGITGVGASELFQYPYWCVEKGYARFAGRRDLSEGWRRRAAGWVRVMHLDIGASMLIYTIATVAFYLLGAGILHGMKKIPASQDMIPTLSNIYTQTLGGWALWIFYAGAIATLYSTIFAASAAHARAFADAARLMGFFAADDYRRRTLFRNGFVVFLTVVPVLMYFTFKAPVKMVVAGGIAQALLLPVVGFGTIFLRHRRLPPELAPSCWTTVALWVCSFIILCVVSYSTWLTLRG